jgi:D-beta-D-heptose 7-phosphate kinase/D-beta-D-heptose 1-phosphate adenosyltransferase
MNPETKPKILVVGDAMVDQYRFGTTTRISPEAPIPVVKVTDYKTFHGGAGNVFTNLVALGAEVRLRAGEPTPIKNRLMVGNTQVARWDTNDEVQPILLEQLDQAILHWTPDAIVVSDYGKGSVDEHVIDWLHTVEGIPIFIDTKSSPRRFDRAARITQPAVTFFPNLTEYTQHDDDYVDEYSVILKRGADGLSRLEYGILQEFYRAYATNVISVCGAGDTVLAAYAYFTALGDPAALFKASIAAAIVVEKPWTATASAKEIDERIRCLDTKKV